MIQNDDSSFDPVTDRGDPTAARAVAALDCVYAAAPPSHLRAAMDRAIYAAMSSPRASSAPVARRWRGRLAVPRRRSAALATVLLLALSGAAGFLGVSGLTGPTPVSAQTILRHAATAGLASNQTTHFVYQITSSTGFAGATQFWVRADANGAPASVAIDRTGPDSEAIPRLLVGAYEVSVAHTLPPSLAGSRVTGQQALDGVPVDVVQEPSGAILYFDAQSYVVRGADWSTDKVGTSGAISWHARLLQYAAVPSSAAPAGPWHRHGTAPPSGATPSGSQ